MPRYLYYSRPHGAVHDLDHWLTIPEGDCVLLLLSARTLYLLQNYVATEIDYVARYASELREDGYYSPLEGESAWQTYLDAANQAKSEVVDMTCDITAVLTGIQDALETLGEVLNDQKIVNLMQYNAQAQNFCCVDPGETTYYEALPEDTANPETSDFCDRCWSWARDWSQAASSIMDQWSIAQQATLGLLNILVAVLDIPLEAVLLILSTIAFSLLEVAKDDYQEFLVEFVPDLACSVATANSPAEAKAAAINALNNADFPDLWPPAATVVLKALVGFDAINKIFDETYPIRDDSVGSDCSCGDTEGTLFLQTNTEAPYDTILVGGPVDDYSVKGGNGNWRTGTGHSVRIRFQALEDTTRVRFTLTTYANFPPSSQTVQIRTYPGDELVCETDPFVITHGSGGPFDVWVLELNCTLTNNSYYQFVFPYNSGEEDWIWKITVEKIG